MRNSKKILFFTATLLIFLFSETISKKTSEARRSGASSAKSGKSSSSRAGRTTRAKSALKISASTVTSSVSPTMYEEEVTNGLNCVSAYKGCMDIMTHYAINRNPFLKNDYTAQKIIESGLPLRCVYSFEGNPNGGYKSIAQELSATYNYFCKEAKNGMCTRDTKSFNKYEANNTSIAYQKTILENIDQIKYYDKTNTIYCDLGLADVVSDMIDCSGKTETEVGNEENYDMLITVPIPMMSLDARTEFTNASSVCFSGSSKDLWQMDENMKRLGSNLDLVEKMSSFLSNQCTSKKSALENFYLNKGWGDGISTTKEECIELGLSWGDWDTTGEEYCQDKNGLRPSDWTESKGNNLLSDNLSNRNKLDLAFKTPNDSCQDYETSLISEKKNTQASVKTAMVSSSSDIAKKKQDIIADDIKDMQEVEKKSWEAKNLIYEECNKKAKSCIKSYIDTNASQFVTVSGLSTDFAPLKSDCLSPYKKCLSVVDASAPKDREVYREEAAKDVWQFMNSMADQFANTYNELLKSECQYGNGIYDGNFCYLKEIQYTLSIRTSNHKKGGKKKEMQNALNEYKSLLEKMQGDITNYNKTGEWIVLPGNTEAKCSIDRDASSSRNSNSSAVKTAAAIGMVGGAPTAVATAAITKRISGSTYATNDAAVITTVIVGDKPFDSSTFMCGQNNHPKQIQGWDVFYQKINGEYRINQGGTGFQSEITPYTYMNYEAKSKLTNTFCNEFLDFNWSLTGASTCENLLKLNMDTNEYNKLNKLKSKF